jgi:DNA-binding MarR family transcriptional regulator
MINPAPASRTPRRIPAAELRAALDGIRQLVQALRAGAREGARTGLSSAQLFALQQIAEHPGASINDVAALTFTHQSSVSVVIQRLVLRRLVRKVRAPDDRRRQQLEPTAAGRRVLQTAPGSMQERLIAAIAALGSSERRTLARALGRIARLLTPEGAGAHPPMLFEDSGDHRRRRRAGDPRARRSR